MVRFRRSASKPGNSCCHKWRPAQGFENAYALASVPGVQRLLFGTLDFQVDLGIEGEGDELAYFRSELVLVSRLAGIQAPVDGPSIALDDAEQVTADTYRARRLGFVASCVSTPGKSRPSTRHSHLPPPTWRGQNACWLPQRKFGRRCYRARRPYGRSSRDPQG